MFSRRPGRGRITKNPFVAVDRYPRARSGDTLARILDSEAMNALLRALVLLFVIDVALGATLALSGSWSPLY
ncbi:MAG: hypothetical protein HY899_17725 [Deltaproteobacteria bacterium]|nr:hypothetical protein [Deltaproteobacteria bacterium]